jgi:thiol-disulfide isomerase/thioredoxin
MDNQTVESVEAAGMEQTNAEEAMTMPEVVEPSTGPTAEQLAILASLPNNGPAPELQNDVWLNSEPLRLADLRGQVVIVDFWTFGCINCLRTIPAVRDLYQTYKDDGLVIIGVHTPEFNYEKELAGVEESLIRLDVPYPVTLDNDKLTWRAYANHYWPAQYLIDKSGNVRALYIGEVHIGDERYKQYKLEIEALLAEEVS